MNTITTYTLPDAQTIKPIIESTITVPDSVLNNIITDLANKTLTCEDILDCINDNIDLEIAIQYSSDNSDKKIIRHPSDEKIVELSSRLIKNAKTSKKPIPKDDTKLNGHSKVKCTDDIDRFFHNPYTLINYENDRNENWNEEKRLESLFKRLTEAEAESGTLGVDGITETVTNDGDGD